MARKWNGVLKVSDGIFEVLVGQAKALALWVAVLAAIAVGYVHLLASAK